MLLFIIMLYCYYVHVKRNYLVVTMKQ